MTAPALETIVVTLDGAIGTITLHRPERHNAMNRQLLEELVAAATWLDDQPELKVVLVRGDGPSFSAGFDLKQQDDPEAGNSAALGLAMATAVRKLQALTVAAVHGHCVGGGVVLAAACDLRIAAASVAFRIPEIDLGIPLFWDGIPLLVRELGPALTKDLVLTCRPMGAQEAKTVGFVNRVAPDAELRAVAQALVIELSAKPRHGILTTKQQVDEAALGGGWGDGVVDAARMAAAFADPESSLAARDYMRRTMGPRPG